MMTGFKAWACSLPSLYWYDYFTASESFLIFTGNNHIFFLHFPDTCAICAYIILFLFIPSIFSASKSKQSTGKIFLSALELWFISTEDNCPWLMFERRVTYSFMVINGNIHWVNYLPFFSFDNASRSRKILFRDILY